MFTNSKKYFTESEKVPVCIFMCSRKDSMNLNDFGGVVHWGQTNLCVSASLLVWIRLWVCSSFVVLNVLGQTVHLWLTVFEFCFSIVMLSSNNVSVKMSRKFG